MDFQRLVFIFVFAFGIRSANASEYGASDAALKVQLLEQRERVEQLLSDKRIGVPLNEEYLAQLIATQYQCLVKIHQSGSPNDTHLLQLFQRSMNSLEIIRPFAFIHN